MRGEGPHGYGLTRDRWLGCLAALVVLRHLGKAGGALEVLHHQRRDAVHQVLGNMVEHSRAEPSDQHEDLEVRYGESLVREILSTGSLQPGLQLLEVARDAPGCELFARLLLAIRGQVDRIADPDTDVFGRVHDL